MSPAALMLAAWAIEAVFGWPTWLYRLIHHPVVWLGTGISWLERAFNQPSWPHPARYVAGALASLLVIAAATTLAVAISRALPDTLPGWTIEALIASSLIASRSLYTHVAAVARPLSADDIAGARTAVSQIVGRDPAQLDEPGVARAALESLAENASDGVTAPLFWGALFGLPGLAAYKAVNTLDSMIGHRNTRYAAFGGFAARLDDVANLIPARLTGLAFAAVSGGTSALRTMQRDARRHRSPNAGWPEAAMAGALGVRLSGPRLYGDRVSDEPWLNPAAPDPTPQALKRGLRLYVRAMVLLGLLLAATAWIGSLT
ncbi:adenosylcobinamide-phosphate synthase CbiB [Hyphomonas oceanitis]|uniref:Cobalamin biosynthesis protein CobD n=1 Tax=Hyphomonas oceanitis SCH89 TaxID=1280953 RepID=A0A059G6X2_9PROT|nr:adenosylcobinamide-phosphate synthase CbiB [Hyphomonas oceanitis]KDA02571.1 cobalamin biosynthesis protein CobD [Hyphomonas oceanitis SCH89]